MDNLLFVVWLLLAPIGSAINSYIYKLHDKTEYDSDTKAIAALVWMCLYVIVAYILYNPS
jgi:hypothetical protein